MQQFSDLADCDLLASMSKFDWSDVERIHQELQPFLSELALRKSLLRAMLRKSREDAKTADLSELLPDMYKYTLHVDPVSKARIRLHLFRPESTLPHSHRWVLASHILSGVVTGKYYGIVSELGAHGVTLSPLLIKTMGTGSFYVMADTTVHWFESTPGSSSLVVRGPASRNMSKQFWPDSIRDKYGAEANQEQSAVMSQTDFEDGIRQLESLGVL